MVRKKSKLGVLRETVRVLSGRDLESPRGGDPPFVSSDSCSFVYSCVVSCTWTSDCTSSTTFGPPAGE